MTIKDIIERLEEDLKLYEKKNRETSNKRLQMRNYIILGYIRDNLLQWIKSNLEENN